MAEGRGIAITSVLLGIVVLNFVAVVDGVNYTVGDGMGWTYGVSGWSNGKNFKAGDVLNFNYMSIFHNVVKVDPGHYRNCTAPATAKVYSSGRDQIVLTKGDNSFICSIPLHCQMGMRISAFAI